MKDESFDKELGYALKNEREKQKMTQQEVADKLGVSKMAVSNWESGNRSMYASTFRDYCKVLGVTMSYIVSKI